jgi:hypothetical protein
VKELWPATEAAAVRASVKYWCWRWSPNRLRRRLREKTYQLRRWRDDKRIKALFQTHPLVQQVRRESITAQEIREHFLSFLARNETRLLCSNCPTYPGRPKVGCCNGCPVHSTEVGCLHRNIACLSYSCLPLRKHLRSQNRADIEFALLASLFSGLDSMRGGPRLRAGARIQLVKSKYYTTLGFSPKLLLKEGETREDFTETLQGGRHEDR